MRCFAIDQLQDQDAEGPDVCLVVIPVCLLDDFRSHPARRAHKCIPCVSIFDRCGDSKVTNADLAVVLDKYILGLEVSVNQALRVEVD